MITFVLKTTDGEVINKIGAETIEIATRLFAEIKRLKVTDLVRMYNVEKLNS